MSNTGVISTSFEPGAVPDSATVPLSVPELGGNEWKYVKECLDTNWVSSAGPFVSRFEQSLAEYVGAKHAVAVVNGTAGIHIALLVAGVQPDDEVLLPALTFIAPANAVRYAGAWPAFLDIEPNHWQLDPQKVLDFIAQQCEWSKGKLINRTTQRRVRAILPVHLLGHPCDLDTLNEIAARYELAVVEDATESLGAKYKAHMLGGQSAIGCFSFNGNKIITTGGGGMIVTSNEAWAERARYLTTQAKDDPFAYVHNEVGFNYRLTNLQAALGCAQMEQIADFVYRKRKLAATYNRELQDVPGVEFMKEAPWAFSTSWLYTIRIDEREYGLDSRALLNHLNQNGIQSRPLWQPMHHSPAHKDSPSFHIEIADAVHRDAVSLPSSVGLNELDQERVISAIRRR
jgi:perosamine synthetase